MTFPILALFDIWALLVLRLVLGIIFVAHGAGKVKNLRSTAGAFTGMGFKPGAFWGTLVGFAELIAGIALVLGFFTQVAALLVAIVMAVATIWKITRKQKFVGGFELDLILFAAAITLVIFGGGAYALDFFLPTALI